MNLRKLKKAKQRTMVFLPAIGYAINKYRKQTRQLLTQFPTGTASILTMALRKDESTKKEYIDHVISSYTQQVSQSFNIGNNKAQEQFKNKMDAFKTAALETVSAQGLIESLEKLVKSLEPRQCKGRFNKNIRKHIRMAISKLKCDIQALPKPKDEQPLLDAALLKQLKRSADEACLSLLQTEATNNFEANFKQALFLFQTELGEMDYISQRNLTQPSSQTAINQLEICRTNALELNMSAVKFANRLLDIHREKKTTVEIFKTLLIKLNTSICNDAKIETAQSPEDPRWSPAAYNREMIGLKKVLDSVTRKSTSTIFEDVTPKQFKKHFPKTT